MTWTKVADVKDLPVGSMTMVPMDEDDIAVYHVESGFYATSDICTHAGESLTRGRLRDDVIACPKHGGKFNVCTGAAVAFPCVVPIATYDVEVRGDEVWVDC